MLKIGTLIDGKYKILSEIGHGGMSTVYLAINEKANKPWAVKEVRKSVRKDFDILRQSLIVETDLLKRLNHPNLPSIVDVIDSEENFLIVMDYIEGITLDRMLQEHGEASQRDVVYWAMQLCDVLDYLHSRPNPIIYRDMKPSNIMLRSDGSVVLIDFGLADKADFTVLKSAAGTTGYIAPEQLAEDIINPQVDIFALGVILSQQKQWKRIAKKCMQANPKKRYLSVGEIKKHIAKPSPWIRRSIIALLLILLVVIGLSVQLYHQNAVLAAQQQSIDSADSKNTALQQQLVDYQEQMDSLKDEYQQEVKVLKQQLHEANDKNQELSRKIREYEPHINRMFHLGVESQR